MRDRDPGIKRHPHPTFENRKAKLGALPDLNLRWAFVGTSGSGKGVAMLDLLLRHYRGVFDRIYLFSKSSTIDKNWDPSNAMLRRSSGSTSKKSRHFLTSLTPRRCRSRWTSKCRSQKKRRSRA